MRKYKCAHLTDFRISFYVFYSIAYESWSLHCALVQQKQLI